MKTRELKKDLPAFEDAQIQESGAILCRVQSAASIYAGNVAGVRRYVALLSKRPGVWGWESAVLLIAEIKDYDNHGTFCGSPVLVVRPGELPNVRPCKLFDALNNGGTFSDILTGVTNWESRAEWLASFTSEERRTAVAIEKSLQALTDKKAA